MPERRAAPAESLGRLRRRLTAWYVATFCAILALLGGGLFVAIRGQLAAQLDASLADAVTELERAARTREQEAGAGGQVVDAVDELRIPERALFLFDTAGVPVKPAHADAWVRALAREAGASRAAVLVHHVLPSERRRSVRAERFRLPSGASLVAVAIADEIELEDRYAALIAAFGGAALVAVVLVAAGGWLLVRESTAPVERTIVRMRGFMADAAHELRTPITVLRSTAEVALQRPRDADAYAHALRGIDGESRRMARIVEDLLTLARADAGERPIARERVFLDDVALDAAGAARALAEAKGVALSVEEFDEAIVHGDATLLRQLVMILLDNAVKFTSAGGGVRVRVGGGASRATLRVDDDGVGIPPADLPRVFDRFWRGDPAHTRTATPGTAGAGLGLSIAQWIAEAHGATIAIDSAPGRGTAVRVEFPAADGAGNGRN